MGNDLLLLPAVTVLPVDSLGRVLLVRQSDSGDWATIGGMVEVDESPASAAVREAAEEAGVEVRLRRLLAAMGGPDFRGTYANGDQIACVTTVYEAEVVGGRPRPDGEETVDVRWFEAGEIATLRMNTLNRRVLEECLPLLARTD